MKLQTVLLVSANILLLMILGLIAYMIVGPNKIVLSSVEKAPQKKEIITMQKTKDPIFQASASGTKNDTAKAAFYVSPTGNDSKSGKSRDNAFKSIQKALDLAQPGDTIYLGAGWYLQDVVTKRSGTEAKPIVVEGPATAVIKGTGEDRIFEVNHNYITLKGFTIDGLGGSPSVESGYRDKLLYVQGKGTKSGVTGLKVLGMTFKNAGGECIRLRYFAEGNELANNTIGPCGIHDYKFDAGGKNGEGIYIGTAPEQRKDGKNPTADVDVSKNNWVHHNTFNTQGNECVDIKEGAIENIVEFNKCTGQKDSESGGMDARGNKNTFRNNEIYGNEGAGVRLGGDTTSDGVSNNVYNNTIKDNKAGGIKFQRTPQSKICSNTMTNNTGGNSVGTYRSQFNPTETCK